MNANLEKKIIVFLKDYLKEAKEKFSFLKGDDLGGPNSGYYSNSGYYFNSRKNGLVTGTFVGVVYDNDEFNVFLRFWEEETNKKNYENIEKKLNILEKHPGEFQNLLGVNVGYHHYEKKVRGFKSNDGDRRRGFSVTFPIYKN